MYTHTYIYIYIYHIIVTNLRAKSINWWAISLMFAKKYDISKKK